MRVLYSVLIVVVLVVVMSHPFSCGQETRVIPRILQLRSHWLKSEKESLRLQEAGITKEVMNSAIAQFCLEIIAKHGEPAPRLCNKDPLTLKMGSYVIELFPNVSSCTSNHSHTHTHTHLLCISLGFAGKVPVHGAGRQGDRSLDYIPQGDNHWLRSGQLPPVHAEVEPRHRADARTVSRHWQAALHDGEFAPT